MSLVKKYPKEVKQILAKYPPDGKRSAVMPLLYLAQRENGYITREAMQEIADQLEMSVTDVGSIVGFYTLFHDKKEGRYRLQVCTDLPCALRGADGFMESLCTRLGIHSGETTPDGVITLEAVNCLAACDRAPMFQVQSRGGLAYYEEMTMDKTMAVVAQPREDDEEPK
jgi:NADH-quinone oxidoreductase subunit E